MGWASGSYLAQELWLSIRKHIAPGKRAVVAAEIYDAFTNADADDWDQDSKLLKDSGINLYGENDDNG